MRSLIDNRYRPAGWEPEAHILDKRVVHRFLRRRVRTESVTVPGEGGSISSRKSSRKGIEAAGEAKNLSTFHESFSAYLQFKEVFK